MSSRAKRLTNPGSVVSFGWNQAPRVANPVAPAAPEPVSAAAPEIEVASIEREAFSKGFEQGELAATGAANERAQAMLQRLTQSLHELTALRATMIRQTERQMVQLALAVARRIVHREISLDQDLLVAMARVALERLGETARATVRLNPEDYQAAGGVRIAQTLGADVTVQADPQIPRGGCRVDSDLGTLDAGVDAQIQELARALLGDNQPEMLSNVA